MYCKLTGECNLNYYRANYQNRARWGGVVGNQIRQHAQTGELNEQKDHLKLPTLEQNKIDISVKMSR
jgi:hypothetical protein